MRPHPNQAFRSPPYLHDGISLDFRFGASQGCYVKVPGGAITRGGLTDLFTFTGDNHSYYMGPAGLLIPSVTNTPRVEYSSGECLGLKVEASRTNLCLHSNDGTNAAWTKTNCTAAKTATGPDGVTNSATTLTATAGNATCLQAITSASATRAYSIWLKRRTGTGNIDMTVDGGTGWTTKTITSSWARYEISQAAVTNPSMGLRIVTNGDAVDFWCSQIESAAFASSSIPTTTASVTRAADVVSRTLGNERSATAGTVVIVGRTSPGQDAAAGQAFWSLYTDNNNRITQTRPTATNTMRTTVNATTNQATIDTTLTNSAAFKAATAFNQDNVDSVFNGSIIGTDTSANIPTMTVLGLGQFGDGGSQMNGHILRFDYWPVHQEDNFLIQATQ